MAHGDAIRSGRLEFKREREIQLPRGGTQRHTMNRARAARGRAVNTGVARICRIDDVEYIECIHPEFNGYAFANREILHQ